LLAFNIMFKGISMKFGQIIGAVIAFTLILAQPAFAQEEPAANGAPAGATGASTAAVGAVSTTALVITAVVAVAAISSMSSSKGTSTTTTR
jgi:hypothetical protein